MRISGVSEAIDMMRTVRVHSQRFRPFTFHVGSRILPRLLSSCRPRRGGVKEPTGRPFSPCGRVSRDIRQTTLSTTFAGIYVADCSSCLRQLGRKCTLRSVGLKRGGTIGITALLDGGEVIVGRKGRCGVGPSDRC